MSARQRWFWALVAFAALPLVAQATIQQQRSQIGVAITINVTPAPVSMLRPRPATASQTSARGIVARLVLDPHERLRSGSAQSLAFVGPNLVAQSANQKAVKVEAEVSPNPAGTLLYSNQTGVQINATAGTSVTVSCAYQITVHTTITSWKLEHGVYNDFASGFPGGDLKNSTYITAPGPVATPFVVYQDDGGLWAVLTTNGGAKTYCVDLTITVPVTVAQGSYTTTAVYTLFY